ncbi:flagellar biosynthetic protein FliR [Candidatus Poribacteria bacterium]|nr:MAG: flagellar biosynthetic protein FliR [Candidatus Poribacteria bacterium]
MSVDLGQIERFLLVLFRSAGIIGFTPFYGSRLIPFKAKAIMSFALAVAIYPIAARLEFTPTTEIWRLAWMILREAGIGLAIGLATYMAFAGIQMAGELMGLGIGFRIGGSFDPQFGMESSIMSQFTYLFALAIFLGMNGHHWFIEGAARSLQIIPLGGMKLSERYFEELIGLSGELFVIALKMAAPVMVSLMLTQAALGLMIRAVPQMNIFVIGFPAMVIAGLFSLYVSINALAHMLAWLFDGMRRDIAILIEVLR